MFINHSKLYEMRHEQYKIISCVGTFHVSDIRQMSVAMQRLGDFIPW
jgi:hypothetical protein